jgi:hypothetical protein
MREVAGDITLHINCNCDKDSRILEYDVVATEAYSYAPTFRRTFLPPKRQQRYSTPYGLMSENIGFFMIIAADTSYLSLNAIVAQ